MARLMRRRNAASGQMMLAIWSTLAGNIADGLLEKKQLAGKKLIVFHEPCVILGRIAVEFRFHSKTVLSNYEVTDYKLHKYNTTINENQCMLLPFKFQRSEINIMN